MKQLTKKITISELQKIIREALDDWPHVASKDLDNLKNQETELKSLLIKALRKSDEIGNYEVYEKIDDALKIILNGEK